MNIRRTLNKGLKSLEEIGNKAVQGISFKSTQKAAENVVEGAAGVATKAIIKGHSISSKIASGEMKQQTKNLIKNTSDKVWTSPSEKGIRLRDHHIKNTLTVGDELNAQVKSLGDKAADFFDKVTSEDSKFKILNKNKDSLVGYKATGKGKLIASAAVVVGGIPEGARAYVDSRRGTYMDNQSTTSAPRIPAYEQNGGATGDLVFSLNKLRHGGMM